VQPSAARHQPDVDPRIVAVATVSQTVVALIALALDSIVGVVICGVVAAAAIFVAWYWSRRARRLMLAAGVLALAMVVSGASGAALYKATSSRGSPTGCGGLPERTTLQLTNDHPPQIAFDAAACRQAAQGEFAVQCRNKSAPADSCTHGQQPEYRLVPNGGVAAELDTPPGNANVCRNAQLRGGFQVLQPGKHYCVHTDKHIIGVTVDDLPAARSDVEVTLTIRVWKA
jgi:hypothetical protein